MSRRQVGVGLVVAALALVVAAYVMWQNETNRAERDQIAQGYAEAISGQVLDEVEADRTGPTVAGVAAGVLFLGGVIVLVSPSSDS